MQRFDGCVLGDKGMQTNKLGSGVHPHHSQQPKGNVPLLDCLIQVPIQVRVLVLVLVLLQAQVLFLNRSPNPNPNLRKT